MVRLLAEEVDGWIAVEEVVPLGQAVEFYSSEIEARPDHGAYQPSERQALLLTLHFGVPYHRAV